MINKVALGFAAAAMLAAPQVIAGGDTTTGGGNNVASSVQVNRDIYITFTLSDGTTVDAQVPADLLGDLQGLNSYVANLLAGYFQ